MHDIEPFYLWREEYTAEEDDQSPFYGRVYDEFRFTQKVYNYFIHPQWDHFGSNTLYTKILFADYDEGYAILEMIGEWNDCLSNDIMFFKREVIDALAEAGVRKYIVICENVLNFHGSDDCYYEEWFNDICEEDGWICFINTLPHVREEMEETQIQHFVNLGKYYNDLNWRPHKPKVILQMLDQLVHGEVKRLPY